MGSDSTFDAPGSTFLPELGLALKAFMVNQGYPVLEVTGLESTITITGESTTTVTIIDIPYSLAFEGEDPPSMQQLFDLNEVSG